MQMMNSFQQAPEEEKEEVNETIKTNRRTVKDQLDKGLLENREVTIEIEEPSMKMPSMNNGLEQMGIDLGDTLNALTPKKKSNAR